uniref:ER membrane protein complex subunit 1 n=1 Tax=Phallusia mammillata TaxID=59560 RepID=A0A6F9DCN0_9ASCI|nr:ER membrane protein complex subunit 1 [Phallusia mammillata]
MMLKKSAMNRYLYVCVVSALFFVLSNALYVDQIGKYDWTKNLIGKVELVAFDSSVSISKNVFVATDKNVVASISAKNGNINWRRTLAFNDGKIKSLNHVRDGIVSVTEAGVARVFEASSGVTKWDVNLAASKTEEEFLVHQVAVLEQSYTEGNLLVVLTNTEIITASLSKHHPKVKSVAFDQDISGAEYNKLLIDSQSSQILHFQLELRRGISVTVYDAKQLEIISQANVQNDWLATLDTVAVLEGNQLLYSCNEPESEMLYLVDFTSGKVLNSVRLELFDIESVASIVSVSNKDVTTHGPNVLLLHGQGKVSHIKVDDGDVKIGWKKELKSLREVVTKQLGSEEYSFFTSIDNQDVTITAMSVKTGLTDDSLTIRYQLPANTGEISSIHINMFLKRTTPIGFRALLTTTADTVLLVAHPNRLAWQRDESLASISSANMLDLPLSDGDAGIEAEFEEAERTSVPDMFAKRVKAQASQVVSFFKQMAKELDEGTLFKHKTRDPLIQVEGLTRDPFSLHKMIVVVTKAGSLFGIDSLNGEVVWRYYSSLLTDRDIHLYVQRTTAHFPHPPQALILGLDPQQQLNPVLLELNPITGEVEDKTDVLGGIKSPIMQATLLPNPDSTHLRPLLLLDTDLNVHLIPKTAETESVLKQLNLYLYDINSLTGLIRSFSIKSSNVAKPTWSVTVPNTHRIIQFGGKPSGEKIDSLGRPLADRSVLFKYLNPNVVAVLSESLEQNVDRCSLMLFLIDAVTGQMIHSIVHKRSQGPVHLVHSENWLLYSYRNAKLRRIEVSALEMYEGKTQFNSTSFSSFHVRPNPPTILQQAYIFPYGISSIGVSKTEKGITSRQILFGLKKGSLFGIPRKLFDPRRSLHPNEKHREEGIMPYSPEVPVPPELFLSYNLTLEQIDGIYCAPSALESTSLVFTTGLDLFFTRTQPSKMFDVLKEDFDHMFIGAVLIGLFIAALVTRRLSQVKQLNKSWR